MDDHDARIDGDALAYTAGLAGKINYILMLTDDASYDEVAKKVHSFAVNAPTAADFIISQLLRGVPYGEITYPF